MRADILAKTMSDSVGNPFTTWNKRKNVFIHKDDRLFEIKDVKDTLEEGLVVLECGDDVTREVIEEYCINKPFKLAYYYVTCNRINNFVGIEKAAIHYQIDFKIDKTVNFYTIDGSLNCGEKMVKMRKNGGFEELEIIPSVFLELHENLQLNFKGADVCDETLENVTKNIKEYLDNIIRRNTEIKGI